MKVRDAQLKLPEHALPPEGDPLWPFFASPCMGGEPIYSKNDYTAKLRPPAMLLVLKTTNQKPGAAL